jgi:hypothetical protein
MNTAAGPQLLYTNKNRKQWKIIFPSIIQLHCVIIMNEYTIKEPELSNGTPT